MKIAFLFPGQGAQTVGMGKDLYEKYEEFRKVFIKASEISEIDLRTLCFNGIRKKYENENYIETEEIGEDLNKTENTQIAIATMSLAILEILTSKKVEADISVGLSLGEYVALINSGFINFEDGIKLLKERGFLMGTKIPDEKFSMAAVIGLDSKSIEEVCEEINKNGLFVVPANYNYSNQTVISGNEEAIEKAIELLKERGARKVVKLNTSGPFHTKKLEKAKEEFTNELKKIHFEKSSKKVIKNIDGNFYSENTDMVDTLSNHITSPVRFDKAIKLMNDENIDTFIEIGPGKVLTGFVKKELPNANVININNVESLENALIALNI